MSELKSTKFKIGDKVKIAESSQYYGYATSDNPRGCVGEVKSQCSGKYYIWEVLWSNGQLNVYRNDDLVPAEDVKRLKLVQEEDVAKDKNTSTQNSIDHFKTLTQKNDVTIMFENGQMKLFWQEFEYIVLDDIELEKVLQAINTLEELRDKMA